jgi:NarL family two-component system response regulator LiaR
MRDTLAEDRVGGVAGSTAPSNGAAPPTAGGERTMERDMDHAHTGVVRVVLVNDYELVVRGLHAMLQPFADRVVVVEQSTSGTPDGPADVALFDTFAARRDALDRAQQMIDDGAVSHVVLFTWDAPEGFLDRAASIGVDAVISKTATAAELVEALERVAAGERVGLDRVVKGERSRQNGVDLTAREQEVLALLALGKSNAEIAHELFLSVDTIKTHVRRVFTKLGVNNRTQAAMRAVDPRTGILRSGSDMSDPG